MKVGMDQQEDKQTLAERMHDGQIATLMIEEKLLVAYSQFETEIHLTDEFDFDLECDYYDNSLEVMFKSNLPYPYEPCVEIRDVLYGCGFDNVYWNFTKDFKDGESQFDEIRNFEPRRSKSYHHINCKYGYVDDRFNIKEWESKYKFKRKVV
jgi:hypothetical protein